jgi:hypothetical protein
VVVIFPAEIPSPAQACSMEPKSGCQGGHGITMAGTEIRTIGGAICLSGGSRSQSRPFYPHLVFRRAAASRSGRIVSICPKCMDRPPFASEVVLSEVADMYPAC